MKLLVNFVIQGENRHRYDSELVEIKLPEVMFSFQIKESDIESEVVKWVEKKQMLLKHKEKIVVLKTLHV
ncbi:MAG: hypothetical protein PHY22_02325 [Acholeplasmataceae bacterium]|jgi:hypothetical protein|nr:hypothetical protein [Acholeplasmataceae bacterium]